MQTKADHARMSRSLDKMKKKEILYDDAVNRQMQMQFQVDDLTARNMKMEARIENLVAGKQIADAELLAAKKEIRLRDEQIERMQFQVKKADEKVLEYRNRNEELEMVNSNMSVDIERKSNQIIILETKSSDFESRLIEAEEMIEQLQQDNADMKVQIASFDQVKEGL